MSVPQPCLFPICCWVPLSQAKSSSVCLAKAPDKIKMNNVLVVDDSPTMRRMVISSLGSLGKVKSTQAGSGLEAIERLAIEPVDLMVLDLNMPDMHGMEVIGFMRSHHAYRDIPIVVLTTKGEEASRSQALAAGANRYLTKPFDPRHLADVVGSLLKAN
jgi:two-component system chemotaxis response regulator CheY